MLNKKELQILKNWAKEAQSIFRESGETDFGELRKREKVAMLHKLEESGLKIETDGDSDGTSESVNIEYDTTEISVVFFSRACSTDYFDDSIYSLQCNYDSKSYESDYADSDMTFDEFVGLVDRLLEEDVAIVNLTPHAVTIYAPDGETEIRNIPSSGIARAEQSRKPIGSINGIPVSETGYGDVEGLPDPAPHTIYIVSALTAQAAKGREDLYITDDIVRDSTGRILGCKALAQIK